MAPGSPVKVMAGSGLLLWGAGALVSSITGASGARVSTVNDRLSGEGSTLPRESVART